MQTYEAVAVPCGGLYQDGQTFVPATYEQGDTFGMLGGHMRVIAAVGMYLMCSSSTFVFSGGTSAKLIDAFGSEAPVEAAVYEKAFLDEIEMYADDPDYEALCAGLATPVTLLDPESSNTASNMQGIGNVMIAKEWGSMAVITNDYHVDRAKAWWDFASSGTERTSTVDFLAAEAIAKEAFPDVHNDAIAAAYQSFAGLKRLQNEATGLTDIQEGRIRSGEFQLVGRDSQTSN